MWRFRRNPSTISNNNKTSSPRTFSNPNFIPHSFKDVEILLLRDHDHDNGNFTSSNDFSESNNTRQRSSSSFPNFSTAAAVATRRLSVFHRFHRIHLANQFARALSAGSKPDKPLPELRNAAAEEKSEKREPAVTIPGAEKRVVVYMTSLRVVRRTFEACRTVQSILRGFRVKIDERDLSMDSSFLDELQRIMAQVGQGGEEDSEKTRVSLPRVFIGGRYIGGADEVMLLHETGELKKLVERLPAAVSGVCEICGDFRFVLCNECDGSHKCYKEKGGFRTCTSCNENGMIRCPSCLSC